jgi:hypothetical protein
VSHITPRNNNYGTRFPKTIAYLEDLDAKKAFDTHEGSAYYCPYCLEKERKYGVPNPKSDTVGKLHINFTKNKGYCFRCDTAVISKKDLNSLKLYLHDLNTDEKPDLDGLPVVNLSNIPPASGFSEAMEYLQSRNKAFTKKNVDLLDLRWVDTYKTVSHPIEGTVKLHRKGIMLPLRYRGQIRSYQIRYITDEPKFRFHTMEGRRLLVNLGSIPQNSAITLCEGFYDAVALACMGFPHPVAMLGKSLSALQMAQLCELTPSHVNLCLDAPALNYGLLRGLRRRLKAMESYKSWRFPGGKDPEDFLRNNSKFKYDLDKLKLNIKL